MHVDTAYYLPLTLTSNSIRIRSTTRPYPPHPTLPPSSPNTIRTLFPKQTDKWTPENNTPNASPDNKTPALDGNSAAKAAQQRTSIYSLLFNMDNQKTRKSYAGAKIRTTQKHSLTHIFYSGGRNCLAYSLASNRHPKRPVGSFLVSSSPSPSSSNTKLHSTNHSQLGHIISLSMIFLSAQIDHWYV